MPTTYTNDALLRLRDILGDRKKGTPGLINMSRSSWYEGVRAKRLPQPVKLGPRMTAWRARDIKLLIENGVELDGAGK